MELQRRGMALHYAILPTVTNAHRVRRGVILVDPTVRRIMGQKTYNTHYLPPGEKERIQAQIDEIKRKSRGRTAQSQPRIAVWVPGSEIFHVSRAERFLLDAVPAACVELAGSSLESYDRRQEYAT